MARIFITGSSDGLGLMAARLLDGQGHRGTLHARNDAVIHNAGVGYREPPTRTIDGLAHVFAVNVLAPYLLTALITPPDRLVYLSSGMHTGGDPRLPDPQWASGGWD